MTRSAAAAAHAAALPCAQILRQVAPQFAERAEGHGHGPAGYAQQDAEEAWVRIVNALQGSLKGLGSASETGGFVQQWMTGRMQIK